ncbi:MAG TPA: hypothetical protein VNS83_05415 [Lapillicoccus sp.]|nr:hypothetical protein [Lapillicoccus sp.]
MSAPRRWFLVRVDLLSGRGQEFDPPPGRVLLVPPATTFEQLAEAINVALGRWDLGHLSRFVLADGTSVEDAETRAESIQAVFTDGIPRTTLLTERVGKLVRSGDRFTYVFDFGDDWTHLCTHEGQADPEETRGLPERIWPAWGWGVLPDQYGRRWAEDDGESPPPPQVVSAEDREVYGGRRPPAPLPLVDLRSVRVAGREGSAKALTDAITGVRLDPALQQVGTVLLGLLRAGSGADRRTLEPYAAALLTRLRFRRFEGDDILDEELLAALQGRQLDGDVIAVDLDELTTDMGSRSEEPGAYVNSRTGEVVPAFLTSEANVGEDAVVDVESEEWLYLVDEGEYGWSDMAQFVETLPAGGVRDRLADAIEGRGAFSRFRRALDDADLGGEWHAFSDDRKWGRARAELARLGIRV